MKDRWDDFIDDMAKDVQPAKTDPKEVNMNELGKMMEEQVKKAFESVSNKLMEEQVKKAFESVSNKQEPSDPAEPKDPEEPKDSEEPKDPEEPKKESEE